MCKLRRLQMIWRKENRAKVQYLGQRYSAAELAVETDSVPKVLIEVHGTVCTSTLRRKWILFITVWLVGEYTNHSNSQQ